MVELHINYVRVRPGKSESEREIKYSNSSAIMKKNILWLLENIMENN